MDLVGVYFSALNDILHDVKKQGIYIKVRNSSGHWAEHFFSVEEVKEFRHREFDLTVLILYDPLNHDSTAIDTKSVMMIEFQRPYSYRGKQYRRLQVLKGRALDNFNPL